LLTVYAAGLANQLRYSWQVLKNYGNMSSATALFVLKEALADKARGFRSWLFRLFYRARTLSGRREVPQSPLVRRISQFTHF
jgi:hypothetical protein